MHHHPAKGLRCIENVYIETGENLRQQKTSKIITNQHHLQCHLSPNWASIGVSSGHEIIRTPVSCNLFFLFSMESVVWHFLGAAQRQGAGCCKRWLIRTEPGGGQDTASRDLYAPIRARLRSSREPELRCHQCRAGRLAPWYLDRATHL